LPRTPVLVGGAARRMEDYAAPPKDNRLDVIGCAVYD
jgi:hypothetical protein